MTHTQTHSLRTVFFRAVALLALPLFGVTATSAVAECYTEQPFVDGARSLFIGHSFFVPVATAFDAIAEQNNFPLHQMDTVFRPGAGGSPGSLWDNAKARAAVEAVLATGEVEQFGLTYFSPKNSGLNDYAQWIDLALQYNPETRFFVGAPYAPAGPRLDTEAYRSATEEFTLTTFVIVDQLRAAYPDKRIEFIAYGMTAPIMKGMYDAGELPDILGLTPDPGNGVPASAALFADPLLGHAGPMMEEVASLSWMEVLYGAGVDTLAFTAYQSDVTAIVEEVLEFNELLSMSGTGCPVIFANGFED